jgi:hypothetical protein
MEIVRERLVNVQKLPALPENGDLTQHINIHWDRVTPYIQLDEGDYYRPSQHSALVSKVDLSQVTVIIYRNNSELV